MKYTPYTLAVGSLMYVMVCTRSDIGHIVGVISRFLSNPTKQYWMVVKWILRYLCGTSKLFLCLGGETPLLEGYIDTDMAGEVDSRKLTLGYVVIFAGSAVSWQSKLQKCITLSTIEIEYITVMESCKEMIWIK